MLTVSGAKHLALQTQSKGGQQKRTKLYIEALEKDINNDRSVYLTYQDNTKTLEELRETIEDWTKFTILLAKKNKVRSVCLTAQYMTLNL